MNYASTKSVPTLISESLSRSEAQIEAGEVLALDPALDRLRASIERMRVDGQRATDHAKS